jgi:hypothetical protein
MTISVAKRYRAILILLGLMVVSLAGLLLVPAIPQDQSYHDFADQRALFGTPNFLNVISNLPFVPIGAVGLWQFRRSPATIVLFLGIFLTGFGSAYYHWNPNDRTLLWDRLPIALSFMAILAIVIQERVDERAGAILLWPLLALAVFSLLLWRWTDDLRLYAWVQFFPFVAMLVLFLTCPPKYTGTPRWIVAAIIYAIAKAFEHFDGAVYSIGYLVSGHTLKHLAAAAACLVILTHFQTRRPIAEQ